MEKVRRDGSQYREAVKRLSPSFRQRMQKQLRGYLEQVRGEKPAKPPSNRYRDSLGYIERPVSPREFITNDYYLGGVLKKAAPNCCSTWRTCSAGSTPRSSCRAPSAGASAHSSTLFSPKTFTF